MLKDTEFDFDKWTELARTDPEGFEQLRQQEVAKIISQSPDEIQHRMQGIQWQIDQIRKTSKTPMAACIKISSMMWDSVLDDNGMIEALERLQNLDSTPIKAANATILNFPKTDE